MRPRTWDNYTITDFSRVIPNYDISLSFSPKMAPDIKDFVNQRLVQLKREGLVDELITKYVP